jgi:hypothetical protein
LKELEDAVLAHAVTPSASSGARSSANGRGGCIAALGLVVASVAESGGDAVGGGDQMWAERIDEL